MPMTPTSHSDGAAYLIETRTASADHVESMLETYYGELLTDVVRSPAERSDCLLVSTSHELPSDAFRRYVEVDAVVQIDVAIRDWDLDRVANACTDAVSDLPAGTTISLVVDGSSASPDDDEVRGRCARALRAADLIVDEDGTADHTLRVTVDRAWAGISVGR